MRSIRELALKTLRRLAVGTVGAESDGRGDPQEHGQRPGLEEADEMSVTPLQCRADWRRDDGYWRCDKRAGHRGRHRLVQREVDQLPGQMNAPARRREQRASFQDKRPSSARRVGGDPRS